MQPDGGTRIVLLSAISCLHPASSFSFLQSAFHRSFTARQCSPLIPDAYLEKEVTLSVSSLIHAISSRVKTDFASSMLKHSIGIRMGGSHGLSTACGRRIADPTVWTESKHRDAIESDHDPRHFLAGE